MKVKSESEVSQVVYLKVIQSCPTPSDPMDCSLPGSSVHGIFQARVLEWGAIAFSGKLDSFMQKNQIGLLSYTKHKNKLKWTKGLNSMLGTINLEENVGSTFFETRLNSLLGESGSMSLQERETKAKVIKGNYNKLNNFCTVKETIKR